MKLLNETAKINFENNINKYRDNIKDIPEEKINEVPPQLALPIFDRFTYITDDELSDLFINLLTTASNKDTINDAHPSFIQLIDRISPDEAKLLKLFKIKDFIPYVTGKMYEKDNLGYIESVRKYTALEFEIELTFSKNVNLYIENFISMGILEDNFNIFKRDSAFYEKLIGQLLKYQIPCPKSNEKVYKEGLILAKGYFSKTNFGEKFIESCTKKIDENAEEIANAGTVEFIPQNDGGYQIYHSVRHNIYGEGSIIALGEKNICVKFPGFQSEEFYIFDDYINISKIPQLNV